MSILRAGIGIIALTLISKYADANITYYTKPAGIYEAPATKVIDASQRCLTPEEFLYEIQDGHLQHCDMVCVDGYFHFLSGDRTMLSIHSRTPRDTKIGVRIGQQATMPQSAYRKLRVYGQVIINDNRAFWDSLWEVTHYMIDTTGTIDDLCEDDRNRDKCC
ncbi:hypothetical protein HY488_02675 [Candidatus Woesearchaeota archaeon]|nr:hypothetical protein [Candidatus Woesearchaeota archaeon]